MSAAPLRRFARLFALLLVAGAATAFAVCPPGGQGSCPLGDGELEALLGSVQEVAASGLAQWIEQSYQTASAAGSQPIPLHIRAQLEPYYDLQVLERARYRVGDDGQFSVANAMLQNPDVNAVTLKDLIVFRRAADARDNVALWAHELKHVQQYQQWGVAEFAARYTRDYSAVEDPAYAIQVQVARALRGLPTATAQRP